MTHTAEASRFNYDGGDISGAYSADRIADTKSVIRKPFEYNGELWCATGGWSTKDGRRGYNAYRIVPLDAFDGKTTTYHDGTRSADRRANELGFYHGMIVKHRGKSWVLVGPQEEFVAGFAVEQGSLF